MEAKMYQLLNDYCDYSTSIHVSSFWIELTTEPNKFFAFFNGFNGTLHEGAIYRAEITLSPEYPAQKPGVKFSSPLPYHCNIGSSGSLCLEYYNKWDSSCTLNYLLEQISNLLHNQNASSCLRPEIGNEELKELSKYEQNVKNQAQVCKKAFCQ